MPSMALVQGTRTRVSGHEIIGRAGVGHGKQEHVVWIVHLRVLRKLQNMSEYPVRCMFRTIVPT